MLALRNIYLRSVLPVRYFSTGKVIREMAKKKEGDEAFNKRIEESMKKVEKLKQKFWTKVTVDLDQDGYNISLDGRKVKTPMGNKLMIGTSRPTFAHLVGGEWEAQTKIIKPHSLPLTSLAARAIDGLRTKEQREEVVDGLIKYLHTDSVLYQQPYPQSLLEKQQKHFTPILEHMLMKYNVKPQVTTSLLSPKLSNQVIEPLRNIALNYDALTLAGMERATIACKSYLIGLALMDRFISVEDASVAAHLEVRYQIGQWGECEDSN